MISLSSASLRPEGIGRIPTRDPNAKTADKL
jgi:hypothetical protein